MFGVHGKKYGFTLVEVLTACSLFAGMVIGIIFAINRTFVFMDSTKSAVMATNLARGGIEMVYNLRDSNRRKYSGERDKRWLYSDGSKPRNLLFTEELKPYYGGTYYVLEERKTGGGVYGYAGMLDVGSGDTGFYTIDGFFSNAYSGQRASAKVDFTGVYSYYSGGTMVTGNLSDLLGVNGFEFYRVLYVYGVYKKNEDNPNIKCTDDCLKNGTPAEMRFCVKVFYRNAWGKHAKELCSIMTNFME